MYNDTYISRLEAMLVKVLVLYPIFKFWTNAETHIDARKNNWLNARELWRHLVKITWVSGVNQYKLK